MPNDDARQRSGERFAADLRARREEHGLSAKELRETLHMPRGLFEAFESGRLVGHPMFNRVYLRSLTRSYADATNTPSAPALSALGDTLEGTYEEGQLQREIEAYDEPEPPPEEEQEGAEGPEEEEAAPATAADQQDEPDWMTSSPPGASTEQAKQREREKEEHAREREREREQRARRQQERREEQARRQEERRQEHRQQRAAQQSAAQQSAAAEGAAAQQERRTREREERPAHHRRRRRGSSNVGRWVAGVLVVAALAVGLYFLLPMLGGGGGGETTQTAAATADTAAGGQQGAQQQDQPPAANLQIGETMNFTVIAEAGPVRDLKVTRDQDVRRPYWIEEGQATVFPTQNRIIIENPPTGDPTLQNVRLLAEGYPYPTDQRDAQGRIVITRQDLQAFADTVRGKPAQIPAQRDTAALLGGAQPQGEEGAAP